MFSKIIERLRTDRLFQIMTVSFCLMVIFLIVQTAVDTNLFMFGALGAALVFILSSGMASRRKNQEFKESTKAILESRGEDAVWSEREGAAIRRRAATHKMYFIIRLILVILVVALLWTLV